MPAPLRRLIDVRIDWISQYAAETNLYAAGGRATPSRIGQVEGYLGVTSAAWLSCGRAAEDWASRADPWQALGSLIARVEAEFSGRILGGKDDLARWRDDPHGLTWAVLGMGGCEALVRSAADLDRLPAIFDRGVRVLRPINGPHGVLGGSVAPGDDRGWTDLGRSFLATLAGLATAEGPRAVLDLAGTNRATLNEALDWFEEDGDRRRRVVPFHSLGAIAGEPLRRLRALGGLVGVGIAPPHCETAEALRARIESVAAIPFLGREGPFGIALATDFLGIEATLPGLGNAPEVVEWALKTFGDETARLLLDGNARGAIEAMILGTGTRE